MLLSKNVLKRAFLYAATSVILALLVVAFIDFFYPYVAYRRVSTGTFQELAYGLMTLFVSPFIETYIFVACAVVMENSKLSIKMFVASLIFASIHSLEAPLKAVYSIAPAVVFSHAYFFGAQEKKERYWLASWTHFIHNGIGMLIALIA